MNATRVTYGDAERQFGVLHLPETSAEASPEALLPVAVLVHGGFWRNRWTLDLMDPMTEDLVEAGFAVWNIEYRSVGDEGGGYPGTLEDVGAAFDALAGLAEGHSLDLERVAAIGHSAGGHMVLWAGSRHLLPTDAPGAGPQVLPTAIIALAPVVDLRAGVTQELGTTAVSDFVGASPRTRPEWYDVAQPVLDPTITTIVVGSADDTVPPAHIEPPAIAAGFELGANLIVVPNAGGEDHFEIIEPGTPTYEAMRTALGPSS